MSLKKEICSQYIIVAKGNETKIAEAVKAGIEIMFEYSELNEERSDVKEFASNFKSWKENSFEQKVFVCDIEHLTELDINAEMYNMPRNYSIEHMLVLGPHDRTVLNKLVTGLEKL